MTASVLGQPRMTVGEFLASSAQQGTFIMEPPGIQLAHADLYRDTALGDAAPQLADR
jgi:hypothetical protein